MIRQVGPLVFAIVSMISITSTFRDDAYNAGFKEGYSYAGKESGGLAPLKPQLGETTQSDTYNRGVIEGYRKFKEKNSFIRLEQKGGNEWN